MAARAPASSLAAALERFRAAFTDGYTTEKRQTTEEGNELVIRRVFHVVPAGSIRLPSGRLLARDPLVPMNGALARELAPGTYQVDISTYELRRTFKGVAGKRRVDVAWLRLHVSPSPVVRLESAFANGEGIAVDSGVVAILSAELGSAEPVPVHFMDDMPPGLLPPYHAAFKLAVGQLVWHYPLRRNAELVAVQPGDGVYQAYWGLDASGAPACLAIDVSGLPSDPPVGA